MVPEIKICSKRLSLQSVPIFPKAHHAQMKAQNTNNITLITIFFISAVVDGSLCVFTAVMVLEHFRVCLEYNITG